jgi:hypothetical protein
MKIVKTRAIISLGLLVTFTIVFISGLGLYFAPNGRIARESNWRFLLFEKGQIEDIHTITAFIMTGLIVVHLIINFKMFTKELKILFSRKKSQKI